MTVCPWPRRAWYRPKKLGGFFITLPVSGPVLAFLHAGGNKTTSIGLFTDRGGPMTDAKPAADIGQLIADHHAAVYRYAFRLTGTTCDAEDLTQQTFLAAHVGLAQLREPKNARAWLFTILRNSYTRMQAKRVALPVSRLNIDLDALPEDVSDDLVVDQERLQQAIDDLPDDFKVVLLLFYFEECSYREIAERLSLPTGTVMSRLARAKARLRARLFETDEAPVAAAAGTASPSRSAGATLDCDGGTSL
jgi:RNA polymerase sigma-70 factor (ECF subfamily)